MAIWRRSTAACALLISLRGSLDSVARNHGQSNTARHWTRTPVMAIAFVRPEICYAWRGPSLLIVNPRGDCDGATPLAGFYYREARFLSTLRLEVNGQSPWLCESAAPSPDTLAFAYTH